MIITTYFQYRIWTIVVLPMTMLTTIRKYSLFKLEIIKSLLHGNIWHNNVNSTHRIIPIALNDAYIIIPIILYAQQ